MSTTKISQPRPLKPGGMFAHWSAHIPLIQQIINAYYEPVKHKVNWKKAFTEHPEHAKTLRLNGTSTDGMSQWLTGRFKTGAITRPNQIAKPQPPQPTPPKPADATSNGHSAPSAETGFDMSKVNALTQTPAAPPVRGERALWMQNIPLIQEFLQERLPNGWINWPRIFSDPRSISELGLSTPKSRRSFKSWLPYAIKQNQITDPTGILKPAKRVEKKTITADAAAEAQPAIDDVHFCPRCACNIAAVRQALRIAAQLT